MKRITTVVAVLLALVSTAAFACPGSTVKDGAKTDSGQVSKPAPK
ncbi:MAG: hypothetical protein WBP72_02305 [Rhodocyclaceae bacterium]